jgi:EAL and modified HD-GYP domain-containing signal transduction protein
MVNFAGTAFSRTRMLAKFIKNLIGTTKTPDGAALPAAPEDAVQAAQVSRLVDTGQVADGNVVTDILTVETSGQPSSQETLQQRFLGREPLLDRSQQVTGYELQLRHPAGRDDTEELCALRAQTLVKSLVDLDIGRLAGGKMALIALPPAMLGNPLLLSLPQKGVVFCVDFGARHDDKLAARCRELKALGYQIALDNFTPATAIEPLLSLAQYVRIDIPRFNAIELARLIDKLLEKAPQAHLIARHVNTEMEFDACHRLFFHHFQGYYFARLQPAAPARVDSDRVRVMELLNMVKNRADITDLEEVFKHDAMLSYKLLLYMNAPVNGLAQKISSIAHAIIILGYEQLYRWLTLLLFTSGSVDPRSKALLKTALVRARLAELLGQARFGARERDGLFIVGVFSLLDVLLNMPMVQAVERLRLSQEITEALTRHSGMYAPYLDLAIACEEADEEGIARIAETCGFDAKAVNQAHIQALLWADDIDL